MYETKIGDARWMAYDIPGNVGWLGYFAAIILIFVKKPEFINNPVMLAILCISIVPAIMMLIASSSLSANGFINWIVFCQRQDSIADLECYSTVE